MVSRILDILSLTWVLTYESGIKISLNMNDLLTKPARLSIPMSVFLADVTNILPSLFMFPS